MAASYISELLYTLAPANSSGLLMYKARMPMLKTLKLLPSPTSLHSAMLNKDAPALVKFAAALASTGLPP